MKAYIFDPLWNELITEDLEAKLAPVKSSIEIITEIMPIKDFKGLYDNNNEKILCLNPDYVNWSLKNQDYRDIPNLKAILPASTDVSWIEKDSANELSIPICDIRGFSTESVSEWAITMMLNVARQIPMLIKAKFPLDYGDDYLRYKGLELRGRKAGIIGLGSIGSAIAERCKGLGMKVFYWSKNTRNSNYSYMELEDLFRSVDVVFPAMAKTDESIKLITNNFLDLMNEKSMLISVVHDLYDHEYICQLVDKGKIYGYGYEGKPYEFSNHKGNIWAAPAYAWATDGSMYKAMKYWIENILNALSRSFPNKIN